MNENRFWVLKKKMPEQPLPGPVYQLQDVTILELTDEGQSFLWPEYPDRGVASHVTESSPVEHQDMASYLVDGEFLHTGGYFANLKEFLLCHSYSEQDLEVIELGSFPSVTFARNFWITECNHI